MLLKTDTEDFIAKDFAILNFYGEDTCFAWEGDSFIHFKFPCEEETEKFKVLKAPQKIKDICSFEDRVFILCDSTGIYKFLKTGEFASLSKNGIELASDFSQVLAVSHGLLTLRNKKTKLTTKLFPITSHEIPPIHVLRLNFSTTEETLLKMLLTEKSLNETHLCIISHDKKIFLMYEEKIQIIHSCDYVIKNIKPVYKNDKVIGMIVQMNTNISIFIHVEEGKLKYDKIFLGTQIQQICAIIDEKNELFLIHSDGERTYYSKSKFVNGSVQKIKTDDSFYNSFKLYQSKLIIYLNDSNVLLQTDINTFKVTDNQNENDYVKLDSSMLMNIDYQTEMICEKSEELKKSLQKLKDFEDKFKRINMFLKKQNIKYCPKDSVVRISNQIFLTTDFKKTLPENTTVVKMLKNRNKTIFSMKNVTKHDTIVDMPVEVPNLCSDLYTTTDLITYKNDDGLWCLIKNYVKDPTTNKHKFQLSREKIEFVKHCLTVLEYKIKGNNISMDLLSNIRREIREKINDHIFE